MLGEGGIRVPMIISMPGKLPQNVVNNSALVSGMDIMPTVAELAGIPVSAGIDGKHTPCIEAGEEAASRMDCREERKKLGAAQREMEVE